MLSRDHKIIKQNFVSIFQINHIYESFIIPYFNQNNYKYIEQDEIVYFEKLYPKYSQNVNFKKILAFNTAFLSKYCKYLAENFEEYIYADSFNHKYTKAIIKLCEDNNLNLYIISSPLADNERNKNTIIKTQEWVNNNNLDIFFNTYFNNIIYLPSDAYSDGIHFTNDYLNANHETIITEMLNNISL